MRQTTSTPGSPGLLPSRSSLRKTKSGLVDTSSVLGDSPSRRTVTRKSTRTTKIIGGHAMAVRDFSKNNQGQFAKLNDHAITEKEFG